jgi:hypothetical protein
MVKRLPLFLWWQLLNAKVAEANGIGKARKAQITAAQTVPQLRHALDVEILHQFAVSPNAQAGQSIRMRNSFQSPLLFTFTFNGAISGKIEPVEFGIGFSSC